MSVEARYFHRAIFPRFVKTVRKRIHEYALEDPTNHRHPSNLRDLGTAHAKNPTRFTLVVVRDEGVWESR